MLTYIRNNPEEVSMIKKVGQDYFQQGPRMLAKDIPNFGKNRKKAIVHMSTIISNTKMNLCKVIFKFM